MLNILLILSFVGSPNETPRHVLSMEGLETCRILVSSLNELGVEVNKWLGKPDNGTPPSLSQDRLPSMDQIHQLLGDKSATSIVPFWTLADLRINLNELKSLRYKLLKKLDPEWNWNPLHDPFYTLDREILNYQRRVLPLIESALKEAPDSILEHIALVESLFIAALTENMAERAVQVLLTAGLHHKNIEIRRQVLQGLWTLRDELISKSGDVEFDAALELVERALLSEAPKLWLQIAEYDIQRQYFAESPISQFSVNTFSDILQGRAPWILSAPQAAIVYETIIRRSIVDETQALSPLLQESLASSDLKFVAFLGYPARSHIRNVGSQYIMGHVVGGVIVRTWILVDTFLQLPVSPEMTFISRYDSDNERVELLRRYASLIYKFLEESQNPEASKVLEEIREKFAELNSSSPAERPSSNDDLMRAFRNFIPAN